MSDGFKTTLATIGSVIFIFFLAFCIGMCTSGFRNKVYDVLDVVPENGQNQSSFQFCMVFFISRWNRCGSDYPNGYHPWN